MKGTFLLLTLVVSVAAHAGSTGTASPHMPQSENASRPFGDWVSDNDAGALNTFYRYFVEVTPALARLQVEIWDADVGLGGGGEDDPGRDRDRGGGFASDATYSLINPAGLARTTNFTTGNAAGPAGADNAWLTLYDSTGETFRDNFGVAAYTNNDGTVNWATNWTETADDGTAGGGDVRITGGELRMEDAIGSIHREANLSNTTSATLTFDFRTQNVEVGDQLRVEVSNNGGASWTTLETFTGPFGASSRTYDISAFIATNTRVRFIEVNNYGNNDFFFVDNFQIKENTIRTGHWEIRVDMTQGAQDNEINAVGIRAHDGTSGAGGTELNVYADSMVSLGTNPNPGAATRTFTLHPWVTSGCAVSQNDFDLDTNNGDTGSATYASRTGAFTQTFTSATLSVDDTWNRDNTGRFNDDDESDDYGIWTLTDVVNTYFNPAVNGNYQTKYVGSDNTAANPPGANPIPTAFRLYLPTDAGAAPVKPYLEQFLTYNRNFLGPDPPQVGLQTTYTVTVRVTNPTAFAITFSAANLVRTNIPGGTVLYGGNDQVSQGTVTAEPAVGGSGNLTWNPGTLAAGGIALLSYDVRVTPVAAGRIPVTATPASGNGTRATFVDETGNTVQARATYTMGGICELAVDTALATEALLSSFELDARGGATTVRWSTVSEAGTLGFNVYRANGERVNASIIPASLKAHGGSYELLDSGNADPNAQYFLEEVTARGFTRRHGPLNHFEGVRREPRRNDRRIQTAEVQDWNPAADASKEKIVAAMVGVRSTGLVRVTAASLATALGITASDVQKAIGKGSINVSSKTLPVAWTTLDGDSILFFGAKNDSIYANDRVYRVELTNGSNSGTTMATVQVPAATTPVSSYTTTRELETDVFAATVLPLDPESDYWFWEALISGDPTYGRKTFNVNVPAVASASGAVLTVRLQGALKDITHRARITMNGVPVGDTTWSSFDAKAVSLSLPGSVLRNGANEIIVEGVLAGGASFDVIYVDGFSVKYQRSAIPEDGRLEVQRSGTVGAGPFTSAPVVLDLTNRLKPVRLVGASFSGGVAGLTTTTKTQTLYFAQSFLTPSFVRPSYEARLKKRQSADWVVIAPRGWQTATESLATLRARDALQTYSVELEQIYDEFAGGNPTPHAIKDFLKSTRNWSKAPRYIVLAGTGTVDYRGIEVAPGPMPPIMTSTVDGLYASDSLFADWNGDRLPDVAIGRIPVSSPAELVAYATKLDTTSRASTASSPIVFSADFADPAGNFRAASATSEAFLAARPATKIYLDDLGAASGRTALLNAWTAGTPLVSWVGHGGLDRLSSSAVLTASDADALRSNGRLPVVVAMTCTINRFENGYLDPLGTALTKEDSGGAVAVWSASGLSLHSEARNIQQTFMRLAQQTPSARVGDLVVGALAQHKSDTSSVYLLLGDPAIRLDLPAEVKNAGGSPSSGE